MSHAGIKNKIAGSCCQSLVNYIIAIFSVERCPGLVAKACKNLPFNLTESPFCPAARWSWGLNNSIRILQLHSHHILSYMPTTELFNCLYLWGKQALLRAAPVWSIIKYNATWKCIRHETRVWTSHSDFLLGIHFVSVHMLTAAVFIFEYLLYKLFQPCAHSNVFFSFAWLLSESVVFNVCYQQLTFGGQ